MALRRYSKAVDGTIPIQLLLYDDEELLAAQDAVGIYDGPQKSAPHQSGTAYSTSHRLFYIDSQKPLSNSFSIDLAFVTQTEYYAGLFTSSPKVTLHLSGDPTSLEAAEAPAGRSDEFESWECEVCAFKNPPGLSPSAARVCGLCGVPRTAVPPSAPSESLGRHLSISLPSSGFATPSLPSKSTAPIANGRDQDQRESIPCPACTFLNHASLRLCEICETELPRPSRSRREMKSAPASRPTSPDRDGGGDPATMFIKVSFRKGGDKTFYNVFKRSLKSKAWEIGLNPNQSTSGGENDARLDRPNVGISGILRTVETSAQGRENHMKDALQDLEALMVKAKDMVRLAAELNEKLTAASLTTSGIPRASSSPAPSGSGSSNITNSSFYSSPTTVVSSEPEEATFIRSSLSQLGLQLDNAPVTQDMMKDERKWFEELARELGRVLQGSFSNSATPSGGMMRERGIIALDEVWGGWNRARGVALIPPSTFLQVLPVLPQYTEPPIMTRTFASGLTVLHTPQYGRAAFAARLSGFLVANDPKTTMDVALDEGLPVALVGEMIEASEDDGDICRDDVSEAAIVGGGSGTTVEVRWWPNFFLGYVWDGQDE